MVMYATIGDQTKGSSIRQSDLGLGLDKEVCVMDKKLV